MELKDLNEDPLPLTIWYYEIDNDANFYEENFKIIFDPDSATIYNNNIKLVNTVNLN